MTIPPGTTTPLPRSLLDVPVSEAAPALLGALLVRTEPDGTPTVARIVETEAYSEADPASHSFRGRTRRNAAMFGPPGTAYVFRSYGMHWCVNVSAEAEGRGAAVLLRAAVLLSNHEHVRPRRPSALHDRDLLRGPGRLAAALHLDGPHHDGADLITGDGGLRLTRDRAPSEPIVAGPRVGVRLAADWPLRFHLAGVPEVSPYRAHPGQVAART